MSLCRPRFTGAYSDRIIFYENKSTTRLMLWKKGGRVAPVQLSKRLRARRNELGLTLAQVADRSGLSLPYISNLERGRGNPTLDALTKLAQALEVPLATLWGGATDGPEQDQMVFVELPASLERFSRTDDFGDRVGVLAATTRTPFADMRRRVLHGLAAAPRRESSEPTADDWRRLLDAFSLILRD